MQPLIDQGILAEGGENFGCGASAASLPRASVPGRNRSRVTTVRPWNRIDEAERSLTSVMSPICMPIAEVLVECCADSLARSRRAEVVMQP